MAVDVRIPTVMRANTAGQAVVSCEGGSVGEVLTSLVSQYPDISGVLFQEDHQLHKYVNMYLESDDIRYIGGLEAPVGDARELTILPAVAGGSDFSLVVRPSQTQKSFEDLPRLRKSNL